MAVLIAALMAFGRFSEDNEINAMRSSGISFLTIIRPAIIFGLIVAGVLTYFNNFIMPEMNFRARMLSGDIYRKRPDMNVEPGHFVDDLPEYSMIIRSRKNDTMEDVRIFSKGNSQSQTSIYANTGMLSTIDDAIILTLFNGEIHELDLRDFGNYRRIEFVKHVITIPADDLFLNRRDTTSRSDREMTIPMIIAKRKNIAHRREVVKNRIGRTFLRVTGDSLVPPDFETAKAYLETYGKTIRSDTTLTDKERQRKERRLRTTERQIQNEYNLLNSYRKSGNKYLVEIHKKFSLPVACILFVMTGASLGVVFRKGGFVIATSLSFGFFLIYYIFLIAGEDMADRDLVSPGIGIWTPNIILFAIASYLLLHTVRERPPLQMDWNIFKRFRKGKTDDSSGSH